MKYTLNNHKMKMYLMGFLLLICIQTTHSQTMDRTVQRSAPLGTYVGILNPDLSVVVDIQGLFREKEDPAKNKVKVTAIECVFGGYLHPSLRGDVVLVLKQDYSGPKPETEVKPEEAYLTFLELPLGLQVIAGRKLVDFGRLNPIHPHHYPFADKPLTIEHIFGCSWMDDGLNFNILIPNPLDVYLKTSFSVLNGNPLDEAALVRWQGRVYNSRTSIDLPWINSIVGYNRAWDEGARNTVENIEITYRYSWPGFVRRRLRLQNEFVRANVGSPDATLCFYSLVVFSFDQYLEIGSRYEALLPDGKAIQNQSASFFATWYWTHSMYLRGQYKFVKNEQTGERENMFFLQVNYGMGPHAHRIED